MTGYGVVNDRQAFEFAQAVVDVIGGGDHARALLVETAIQETQLGHFDDRYPLRHGVGICQCDFIAFKDTKERTPAAVKTKINEAFNLDIDLVLHNELAYSPLLAFIWCRLHYLLRPGAIPTTVDERGAYWKKWYNSELGRGSAAEYVRNNQEFDSAVSVV